MLFVKSSSRLKLEIDRRVLTADIDAELGLITCVVDGVGQSQTAHPRAEWRELGIWFQSASP